MPKSVQTFFHGVALILLTLTIPSTARAEVVPGNACATNNQVIHSGGPENSGAAYWMVCQGGTWRQIFSVDANGMASTNTPTSASHVATKAYVDANGGTGLNVYRYDGTTLLGKYLGSVNGDTNLGSGNNCQGMTVLFTGQEFPRRLTGEECGIFAASGSTYYTGANCTGATYMVTPGIGITCQGAGACTSPRSTHGGGVVGVNYGSYRDSSGGCNSSASGYYASFYGDIGLGYLCSPNINESCKVKP